LLHGSDVIDHVTLSFLSLLDEIDLRACFHHDESERKNAGPSILRPASSSCDPVVVVGVVAVRDRLRGVVAARPSFSFFARSFTTNNFFVVFAAIHTNSKDYVNGPWKLQKRRG
jgi:hypothetical protein